MEPEYSMHEHDLTITFSLLRMPYPDIRLVLSSFNEQSALIKRRDFSHLPNVHPQERCSPWIENQRNLVYRIKGQGITLGIRFRKGVCFIEVPVNRMFLKR